MYLNEKVIENRAIGYSSQKIFKLVLKGQLAKTAQPGQFVHIRVAEGYDPLLRRPLSIAGINREAEEITIYYRVFGKGTELLSRIRKNDYISVLGPLGTGFTLPKDKKMLLVAGGIGVFPLFALLEAIECSKVKFFWGGESKEFLESADLAYLQNSGADYELATLDGSLGYKGLVTDLLEAYLQKNYSKLVIGNYLCAAACGPKGMLKAVTQICLENNIPVEVSLEERMACGVGACLGCVCTVLDENGNLCRKRVCKEGPVFSGEEVVWDAEV